MHASPARIPGTLLLRSLGLPPSPPALLSASPNAVDGPPRRQAGAGEGGDETPSPPAVAQRLQTFIVEDSPIMLDNLIATLEEMAPVQVVGQAPDEPTALRQLHELGARLDLVIIDILLKSGSGLGVLRGLAATGLGAKYVVLTSYATVEMRERCRQLGADRVFDKSKDLDALIDYCNALVH